MSENSSPTTSGLHYFKTCISANVFKALQHGTRKKENRQLIKDGNRHFACTFGNVGIYLDFIDALRLSRFHKISTCGTKQWFFILSVSLIQVLLHSILYFIIENKNKFMSNYRQTVGFFSWQ